MTFSKSPFLLLLSMLVGLAFQLKAQEKCGTVLYDKLRKELNPRLEDSDQFEKWMKGAIPRFKNRNGRDQRLQATTYVIPVVIHVIHNGEALNSGGNISDAQINSQIEVLNRDFPRLNPDSVNTPAEFKPVAGSIDLQFVLAKQDPEGLPTTGIVRLQGTKTGWTLADNTSFKALSYWPAEDYLNIWILNFVDPDGIIGYAQLPVSSLAGLENGSDDRLTDGVAIDYRAFGNVGPDLFTEYNLGRTATHEIGHIFGLRHIWGDDGSTCTGSDYCDDTPNQGNSYNGDCPSTPQSSCGTSNMYQNYMDYTDDACMNLFSKDQVDRMVVVLANSPRRNSLLTSPGATIPTQVANDLGIKRIASPGATSCTSVTPGVVVRNYGSNNISSARIQLRVNGTPAETKDITFPSAITYPDSSTVVFSAIALGIGTINSFTFEILLTNGVADGKAANNLKTQDTNVPLHGSLPMVEAFNTMPANWTIVNPDGGITWVNIPASNGHPDNKAMAVDFYDYDSRGEEDQMLSPVFDLSTDTVAVLKFDRAYAAYSASITDRLRVIVLTGCTFSNAFEIFNKSGTSLATVGSSTSLFVPASAADWKTETISLAQFLGEPNVRIAFVATNDYGNNLYLDNIRIINGSFSDLTLVGVKSPSPVTCISDPTPVVTVRNNGSDVVTTVTVSATVNGAIHSQTFNNLQMDTGEEQDFTLTPWPLNSGNNPVNVSVEALDDAIPDDNTVDLNEVVNTSADVIPIREDFDSNFADWTIVSEGEQMKWIPTSTNKNISIAYDAFASLAIGNKSWLVSPDLDFSKTTKAGLFFDLSYGKAATGNERLQILSSEDCGQTFPTVLFDQTGDQFKTRPDPVNSAYTPHLDADWTKPFVNLDPLVGNKQVRIAFVVTNDNGNNLYLDNIEIFADDDPSPLGIGTLYAVYNNNQPIFKITFKLPEKELVRLQVYNSVGQLVLDNDLPDTLNQTYDVDLSAESAGIYIVRMQIGNDKLGTAKVLIPH